MKDRPEGIRAWYESKTRLARKALIFLATTLILGAILFFIMVPFQIHERIQTFSGAIIIPGFGGLWMASFVYIWLLPMREVGFRGQESMERMEDRVEGVTKKGEETFDKANEFFDRLNEGDHPVIKRLEKTFNEAIDRAVERMKSEIHEERKRTEAELGGALDAGERKAARILEGKDDGDRDGSST